MRMTSLGNGDGSYPPAQAVHLLQLLLALLPLLALEVTIISQCLSTGALSIPLHTYASRSACDESRLALEREKL